LRLVVASYFAHPVVVLDAAATLAMNASTLPASLSTPPSLVTPLATSTAVGCDSSMAPPTLLGVSPPARIHPLRLHPDA
jgi:hypothetical protein